ncbi:hypothetical protein M378DRAFT_157273, partial [Amanita muscaria Koide BX008]
MSLLSMTPTAATFMLERFDTGTVSFRSTVFNNVYLRLTGPKLLAVLVMTRRSISKLKQQPARHDRDLRLTTHLA